MPSGPPERDGQGSPSSPLGVRRRPGLRATAGTRLRRGLGAWVAGASDEQLDRVAGSAPGRRMLLAALRRSVVPGAADGATGELSFELRRRDGTPLHCALVLAGDRQARVRPGAARDPLLTVRASLVDAVRIAVGELDPGRALLEGRVDLVGDFTLATRLGSILGRPGG